MDKKVFSRIIEKKNEKGLTWDEISQKGHIRLSTWMTGILINEPSPQEMERLAKVLGTTKEWLENGQ